MYFEQERIDRIVQELLELTYSERINIKTCKIKKGDYLTVEAVEKSSESWKEFICGKQKWGGKDNRYWFRVEVIIPEQYEGKEVIFELKTGQENEWDLSKNPQCIIRLNGEMIQGLDINHRRIGISKKGKIGEKFIIDIHAYAGMEEHVVDFIPSLAIFDDVTEKIYYDLQVPLEVAKLLQDNDKRRIDLLRDLNNAINLLDFRRPYSKDYYDSLEEARKYLDSILYSNEHRMEDVTATCIGHTHIDVAWLWTLKQTREKVTRSFSTVLNLMKKYPEYLFMSSQPQLFKFLKQEQPELYQRVKEKVKEGRFEPEGAMWLEADCNLSSGESLIRQILFGTRFFREEFGVESKILWLPDVFGYSIALPQILNKFGIKYFMTTKISWNEYNRMPYDTFIWEGIDGSEVLTHFITTTDYNKEGKLSTFATYNGIINASNIMGAWQRYQQKHINDDVLVCFGHGDGGGGPTKEMLETARRMNKGIPGCPTVKMGKALDYFERLDGRVSGHRRLPKWVGELYLEYHRGTYTSMARNKRYNRKCECLYQDAELVNIINNCIDVEAVYPRQQLNDGWETILLNQFHDIIPGSSIKEVYDESKEQYEEIIEKGNSLLSDALDNIISKIKIKEKSVVIFNTLSFERDDVVEFETDEVRQLVDDTGTIYPVQKVHGNKVIAFLKGIPAKGYKTFGFVQENVSTKCNMIVTKDRVETPFYNILLDNHGHLTSVFDKVNERELLKVNGKGNVIQAFEDKPHNYDAWDINIYYQEKMWEVNDVQKIEIVETGPVRAGIKIIRKFLDSTIEQFIYLYNDSARIDFVTNIDWKEKQILLKAAFPIDVHTNKATYEIQYGNVERPTHWNTSWDYARFEVCGHKWADLSENDFGVSLLNDCKYGYDIKDSVMRLSLLKSAINPNKEADKEIHKFTYSIYSHEGSWRDGKTIQMAYNLNCPLYAKVIEIQEGELDRKLEFITVNKDNVIIEVVKKAEDRNEIIIRLYECYNRRTDVNICMYKEIEGIYECDLHENKLKELNYSDNTCFVTFEPYEIKTLSCKLKSENNV